MSHRASSHLVMLLASILAALSVWGFLRGSVTAFDWPAIDMAPFFMRQDDPTILQNDFFTNASAHPNPRLVFGWLVLVLCGLTGVKWYAVFFFLKCFFSATIVPLFFILLARIINLYAPDLRAQTIGTLTVFLGACVVLYEPVWRFYSIAWWPPISTTAIPQSAAIFLGLCGLIASTKATLHRSIGMLMLIASSTFHPAIGLFMATFYALSLIRVRRATELLILVAAAAFPGLAMAIVFRPALPLSASEYVRFYAHEAHPSHYVLASLGSLSAFPWWVSFTTLGGLMALGVIIGLALRERSLVTAGTAFLTAYLGSVALQYFCTDLVPVKALAAIGPIRFSFLGYWMLVLLLGLVSMAIFSRAPEQVRRPDHLVKTIAAIACLTLLAVVVPPRVIVYISHTPLAVLSYWVLPALLVVAVWWFQRYIWLPGECQWANRAALAGFACLVALLSSSVYRQYLDNPIQRIFDADHKLYTWLRQNTERDSVTAAYFSMFPIYIPIVAQRAVFTGNGFPFREDFYHERTERNRLLYGSYDKLRTLPGAWEGARRSAYYRRLTPENFVAFSKRYRLDYVMIEKRYSQQFAGMKPLFDDGTSLIFNIRALSAATATEAARPRAEAPR